MNATDKKSGKVIESSEYITNLNKSLDELIDRHNNFGLYFEKYIVRRS